MAQSTAATQVVESSEQAFRLTLTGFRELRSPELGLLKRVEEGLVRFDKRTTVARLPRIECRSLRASLCTGGAYVVDVTVTAVARVGGQQTSSGPFECDDRGRTESWCMKWVCIRSTQRLGVGSLPGCRAMMLAALLRQGHPSTGQGQAKELEHATAHPATCTLLRTLLPARSRFRCSDRNKHPNAWAIHTPSVSRALRADVADLPDCGSNACSMHPPVLVRCNHGSGITTGPGRCRPPRLFWGFIVDEELPGCS